jgi:hypothetical protein
LKKKSYQQVARFENKERKLTWILKRQTQRPHNG